MTPDTAWDLSRLSPAERLELAELQADFAAAPDIANLTRMNVLQGRATRPEVAGRSITRDDRRPVPPMLPHLDVLPDTSRERRRERRRRDHL